MPAFTEFTETLGAYSRTRIYFQLSSLGLRVENFFWRGKIFWNFMKKANNIVCMKKKNVIFDMSYKV